MKLRPRTITKSLSQGLDGCHMRHLLNTDGWTYKDHVTNAALYKNIACLSAVLRARILQYVGHSARSNQPVADLVL